MANLTKNFTPREKLFDSWVSLIASYEERKQLLYLYSMQQDDPCGEIAAGYRTELGRLISKIVEGFDELKEEEP